MVKLLHHLLQASAEAHADEPAVVGESCTLTYAEVDGWSSRLAHLLLQEGVAVGDRVGIYFSKTPESVVAVYAALKAGAAYVPLDPQAPVSRLAYIARDCGIRVLLSGSEKRAGWGPMVDEGAPIKTVIVLKGSGAQLGGDGAAFRVLGSSVSDAFPSAAPRVSSVSLDLAYILYTSGSTGQPKGVMLSHQNALTFVEWAVAQFDVTSKDRLSNHAPLHFDLSTFDVFGAAAAGASVVPVPPKMSLFPVELARFLENSGITVWYSVPSVLTMLVSKGSLDHERLPGLRTILFAGEVFPIKYLRRLMRALPHARFANLYGPTETNVCTWYEVAEPPEEGAESIPIGRAISDVEVFAITPEGTLAERGEVGELHVRGSTVMQGYWGDADRTRRSLVSHPVRPEAPGAVYRTGDLVREAEDGNYLFLGRTDAQIKSRGYRIELGDVEAALYAHPAVIECVVVALPDDLIGNRLVACVSAKGVLGADELIRFCTDRIPRYMIPDSFRLLDRGLPKTSTGKIDRQAVSQQLATE